MFQDTIRFTVQFCSQPQQKHARFRRYAGKFADGQRLRDEAAEGLFAIVVEPVTRACQLLVLGQAERVLRRIDLTEAKPGSPGLAQPGECGS